MNETDAIISLSVAVAMWLVVLGFATMIWQSRGFVAVFSWPFRTGFRFIRWAIGGMFVTLGKAIRGGGQQQNRRRH